MIIVDAQSGSGEDPATFGMALTQVLTPCSMPSEAALRLRCFFNKRGTLFTYC